MNSLRPSKLSPGRRMREPLLSDMPFHLSCAAQHLFAGGASIRMRQNPPLSKMIPLAASPAMSHRGFAPPWVQKKPGHKARASPTGRRRAMTPTRQGDHKVRMTEQGLNRINGRADKTFTAPADTRPARSPAVAHWTDRARSSDADGRYVFPAYGWSRLHCIPRPRATAHRGVRPHRVRDTGI